MEEIMPGRNAVKSCLYNFLGYGNPSGCVWFLGSEESGAEIWKLKKVTVGESLALRSRFELAMDLSYVWENLYRIPLENLKGPATWRYIAAFLQALQGIEPGTKNVRQYVFEDKLLGRLDSDHFICPFMPLPRPGKNSIYPYDRVWAAPGEYYGEVGPGRERLFLETLRENEGVKLVVSYDRYASGRLLRALPAVKIGEWTLGGRQRYMLFSLQLNAGKHVYFLRAPFFAPSQVSYKGINKIVNLMFDLKKQA